MMKKYFLIGALLLCAKGFSQNGSVAGSVQVHIAENAAVCGAGTCVDLLANFPNIKATSSYSVATAVYQPLFSFTGGTLIPPAEDDKWSPLVDLPFNFCFYGNVYNQILVGTNGVITFDTTGFPDGNCPWQFNSTIPNPAFPIKNAIYGVYQDTDIRIPPVVDYSVQNVNYYVTGTAPNRAFVANFNQLPAFQCNADAGLQTTQIILLETSNIIEIYVKNRSVCASWQNGFGVIGIQNQNGTMASAPENRNTGSWSAVNEAYRFTPNGESVTELTWLQNGNSIGTTNPINVCPADGDIFTAVVTYDGCSDIAQITDERTINYVPLVVGNTVDLTACSEDATAMFDLTQEEISVYAGLNPGDYEADYYVNAEDAQIWSGNSIPFTQLANFEGINGQTIYMRIGDLATGTACSVIKPFTLIINTPPTPPTGDSEQSFSPGQTLADIDVNGANVNWYAEATGGSPLPMDTPLVNGTTYYATQINTATGCESASRNTLSNRLAVTVYDNLSTGDFGFANLKVHPNPTKDILNVSAQQTITSVAVFNLLGQRVMVFPVNATSASINVSKLATGTYMMRIDAGTQMKTVKIVKE